MLIPQENKNLNDILNDFKEFIAAYKQTIIYSFLFAFVSFGFMLTSHSLTIDEETWINSKSEGSIWLWLVQGRFGIFLIDKLLVQTGTYIPFLWDFLSILVWNFAGVCFLFCISRIYPKFNKFSSFVFCAYFSSLPFVVGEILSYSMFNFQQSLAMISTSISVYFIYTYFSCKKVILLIISSFFLFISISFYQAFMVVYIVMIIAYALISVINIDDGKINTVAANIYRALISFILGVLAYYIVNKFITTYLAPDPGNYLLKYVGWSRRDGLIFCLKLVLSNIKNILLGSSLVYGGKAIFIVTCLFIVYSVVSFIYNKGIIKKLLILILTISLLLSPFALSIVLGTRSIVGRTYIALSLAGAIELFLINNMAVSNKVFKRTIAVITCFVLFLNAMFMNRLFYDSYIVYQYDRTVGNQIMHDIAVKGYNFKDKPVVFIGMHDIDRMTVSAQSGSTGGSFFSWDDGNNHRIINFLKSEGYGVFMASKKQIRDGYETSKNMPSWPNKDSIKETDEYIIVKLSNPSNVWLIVNGV